MNFDSDTDDFDQETREEILRDSQRELIFKLMFKKSDPKEWAEWLRAPLEHACEAGDSDLVDALLEAGADGSARGLGGSGRTLLHAAATGGNESVVWSLLDGGAKPDIEVKRGDDWVHDGTPLQVAVRGGRAAAAKVLVAAGADMSRTLIMAVDGGHERLACDLLLAGADPDEPGIVGQVLMRACGGGYERLVRALLQKGAEVCFAAMGHTPLHEAARGGHANIARVLLAAGLDAKASGWQGETPLHAAAGSGSAAAVDVLIAAGVDVGARHPTLGRGQSPLHVAAQEGNAETALALLRQHGADVNAVDNSGLRPLHLACKRTRTEMVDLLLRWGADEAAVDGDGRAPVDLLPTVESIRQDAARYCMDTTQGDRYMREELGTRDRAAALLTRAPNDRAWRRRGFTVLCRAHPERLRLACCGKDATSADSDRRSGPSSTKLARRENPGGTDGVRGSAARGEAGAGEDGGGGAGIHGLTAWLVDLQVDGIFRNIVGFL